MSADFTALRTQTSSISTGTLALPPSSLVICSRNRPRMLSETVDSVLKGDQVPSELVIIDQSDNAHAELSMRAFVDCRVSYLWARDRGLGRARNAGVQAAIHPIIAFIDDDMWVAPDWYGKLIRALVDAGPHAVVTGQVLPSVEDKVPKGFAPSTSSDSAPAVYRGRILRDVLSAGNMALYRRAVEQVGLFDSRLGAGSHYPSSEDNDFGFRLLEARYEIRYIPGAVVYHRAWRAPHDLVPLQWRYGRGQGAFYAKHLSLRDRYMWQRLIQDMEHYLANAPRWAWRRELNRSLGDAAFALGILSGAAEWLLTQRRTR